MLINILAQWPIWTLWFEHCDIKAILCEHQNITRSNIWLRDACCSLQIFKDINLDPTRPVRRVNNILWLLFNWIDMLANCSLQTKLFMSSVAFLCQFLCMSKRFNEIAICCACFYLFILWELSFNNTNLSGCLKAIMK